MKRKKFIRLMMARGIQRNQAVKMASYIDEAGSYKKLYHFFALSNQFSHSLGGVIGAIKMLCEVAKEAASIAKEFSEHVRKLEGKSTDVVIVDEMHHNKEGNN